MARLLDWPHGLETVARSPLTGPRTVGSSSSEAIGGYVQTTASAFGAWRWQFTVRPMRGALFKRYRGMVTALHGGANAVRVPWCDPDLYWPDAAVDTTREQVREGMPWDSNGTPMPWEDTQRNWRIGRPTVAVGQPAAKGTDIVYLADDAWTPDLAGGEWLGFEPSHFGLYCVTEVFPLESGKIRIWPPLRKAIVAGDDSATLAPVIAMRLENEAAATAARGTFMADGNTLTLVEVEDADVRAYFTG